MGNVRTEVFHREYRRLDGRMVPFSNEYLDMKLHVEVISSRLFPNVLVRSSSVIYLKYGYWHLPPTGPQ